MAGCIRAVGILALVLLLTACNSALKPKVTYDPTYSFHNDEARRDGARSPSVAVVPDMPN